jgi:hypothetical protein
MPWSRQASSATVVGGAQRASQARVTQKDNNQKARALNALLLQSTDAAALLRTLSKQAAHANSVNVATAWHRLATLSRSRGAVAPSARQLAELEELTAAKLPQLDARCCANVLWAHGVLRARAAAAGEPLPLLRPLLAAAAAHCGPGLAPEAASSSAWAAASLLPAAPTEATALLVQLLQYASPASLSQYSAQSIANMLWAAASATGCVTYTSYAHVASHAAARLAAPGGTAQFKPIEQSCIAWALAELRFDPGPKAMEALDASTAQQLGADPYLSGRLSVRSLVNSIWAFAVLGYTPSALLRQLQHEPAARAAATAVKPSDVSLLLWSMALIDGGAHIGSGFFRACWSQVLLASPTELAPIYLRSLFQTNLLVQIASQTPHGSGSGSAGCVTQSADVPPISASLATPQPLPPLPQPLLSAAEAAWRVSVSDTTTSELHAEVLAALQALPLPTPPWVEKLSPDRLFSIDIGLHFPDAAGGWRGLLGAAEPPPLGGEGASAPPSQPSSCRCW